MRRPGLALVVLALLAAACGEGDAIDITTTGAPDTSTTAATTTAASTTPDSTTTAAPSTTAPATTTTAPGTVAVGFTAYCVRGTAPDDALNVRSGPGTGFDVVGELAWNAADVSSGGLSAPDDQGRPWFLLASPGGPGWAASWYLEPAPCDPTAITVAPLAGPGWPDALAGGLVPWAWVDEEWALALYAAAWDGPRALYLLSPFGDAYEVFAWTGGTYPFALYDWRPDGRAALAMVGFDGSSERQIHLLDLVGRGADPVLSIADFSFDAAASFTRPTGRDLVVKGGDAATELIEVRRTDGSLFSTLLDRPRPADWGKEATWVYGLEGTTVVLADGDGVRLLSNTGEWIRDLDAPGQSCRVVRWWDDATVLTRCLPPEVLAYLPDAYYGRLWLVPVSGAPATALTALPATPVDIVDFGYFDAWRAGGRVFANWAGDCGAGAVDLVRADGTTAGVTQNALVGTIGANLLVRRWTACDQSESSLHLVGPDGTGLRDLLVPPAGAPGVIDALLMGSLP